jgi:hypothetical protein
MANLRSWHENGLVHVTDHGEGKIIGKGVSVLEAVGDYVVQCEVVGLSGGTHESQRRYRVDATVNLAKLRYQLV